MEKNQIGLVVPEERIRLKKLLDECNVLLFTGKTGSGKTTHIPLILWEYLGKDKMILCTQTKRLPTETTPKFIAKFSDDKNMDYIGYRHKYEEKMGNKTQIVFATDGKVLKDIKNDYTLSEYGGIVLDEVHERTVNIDILIALITDIMRTKRKDLKIIVMSAGANMDRFEAYFKSNGLVVKEMELGSLKKSKRSIPEDLTAPTGWEDYFISENNYPTEKKYLEFGVDRIVKICEDKNSIQGNIIYFLPGSGEIKEVKSKLSKNLDNKKFRIVELSSLTPDEEKNIALGAEGYTASDLGYERIIILSTNVAEASVTPKNLSYVIDSGRERSSLYDPIYLSLNLDIKFVTKANVKQRKGRVGRTSDGYVYFMYTKREYDEMNDFLVPNIVKSDITGTVLDLLTMPNTDNYNKLNVFLGELVDQPSFNTIKSSFSRLLFLGAVDRRGSLTSLGKILSQVGTEEVELSKALLYSLVYNCRNDMIKIISMLSLNNQIDGFFNQELKLEEKSFREKIFKRYKDEEGDHFTLIKIFDHLLENINSIQAIGKNEMDTEILIENWLYKNYFVNYKDNIKKVINAYYKTTNEIINNKEIENYAKTLKKGKNIYYENEYMGLKWKISDVDFNNHDNCLLKSILSGYFMNICFKPEAESKKLRKLRPNIENSLYQIPPRKKILYNENKSNLIVFTAISNLNREGLTINTISPIIDKKDVFEIGFHYYLGFKYYPEQARLILENLQKNSNKNKITNIDFIKGEEYMNKELDSSLIIDRYNLELDKRLIKENEKLSNYKINKKNFIKKKKK